MYSCKRKSGGHRYWENVFWTDEKYSALCVEKNGTSFQEWRKQHRDLDFMAVGCGFLSAAGEMWSSGIEDGTKEWHRCCGFVHYVSISEKDTGTKGVTNC